MPDPLPPRSRRTRDPRGSARGSGGSRSPRGARPTSRLRNAITAVAVLLAAGAALAASIATDSTSLRTSIALLAVAVTASALRRFTAAG